MKNHTELSVVTHGTRAQLFVGRFILLYFYTINSYALISILLGVLKLYVRVFRRNHRGRKRNTLQTSYPYAALFSGDIKGHAYGSHDVRRMHKYVMKSE